MPFETFIVKPGSDSLSGGRKHEEDITRVFETIKARGGEFVTALALADHTTYAGEGGKPNGAAYIVAEFPDDKDCTQ
jgi:hypothetical protein